MRELYERFLVFIRSAYAAGEQAGLFSYIWRHYHRRIGFYISNFIPFNDPAFDDLFQDVMIKIYLNLHTFNPLRSFKAWVYQISRNHCLDYLRENQRLAVNHIDIEIERIPHHNNPEKNLMQEEDEEQIHAFLATLDPEDREITYLRFYENLTYGQISQVVGLHVSTTKSRVAAIKKKLKKTLEK